MCTKRNNDEIIKQIVESQDPDHMRRLLEEINECIKCPENSRGHAGPNSDCHCRQHFQTELKNQIYAITYQVK